LLLDLAAWRREQETANILWKKAQEKRGLRVMQISKACGGWTFLVAGFGYGD
jgi:hypothetical protein